MQVTEQAHLQEVIEQLSFHNIYMQKKKCFSETNLLISYMLQNKLTLKVHVYVTE